MALDRLLIHFRALICQPIQQRLACETMVEPPKLHCWLAFPFKNFINISVLKLTCLYQSLTWLKSFFPGMNLTYLLVHAGSFFFLIENVAYGIQMNNLSKKRKKK